MKAIELLYKPIILLLTAAMIFVITNNTLAQEKKKIIRVIEVDDKGEKVIREINVPQGDKKIKVITDGGIVNIDSIDRVMKVHINKIGKDLDSLGQIWIGADQGNFIFDHDFDFDFDFDIPTHLDVLPGKHIMLFDDDSLDKSMKMYFREKNFENKKDLEKVLEEVENGTFDPKKWDMQEVDKERMRDLKGKGNFFLFSNEEGKEHKGKGYAYVTAKCEGDGKDIQVIVDKGRRKIHMVSDTASSKGTLKTYTITTTGDGEEEVENMVWVTSDDQGTGKANIKVKTIEGKWKHGVVYVTSGEAIDSLSGGKEMTWTVTSDGDDDMEKVIVIGGDGNEKHQKVKIKKVDGSAGSKDVMVTFVADEKGKTNVQFTDPSADEMKMLVKNGFAKSDEKNKIESLGLMVSKKDGNEKYTIVIKSDESGKVKLILSDDKGKKLKTEEFEHKKGKTEHELGFKDLKSGIYYLQLQLNSKSATKKVEITKK